MQTALFTGLALVAFAANSVLCRLALAGGEIDAISFTVIRFASGAVALLVAAGWPRRRVSLTTRWTPAVVLALYAVPFALAYTRLSAGTGALIMFGSVQVTMMSVALGRGERPSALTWFGLAAALAGLVYLVRPGLAGPPPLAAGLMALAGASWGIYTLRGRASREPLVDTARSFAQTIPMLLAVSLASLPAAHAAWTGIGLALASGVLASGAGYALWYSAVRSLSATSAAVVQLAVPVLTALGGVAFLGERVTLRLAVSATLVLGGIGLALAGRSAGGR